MFSDRRRITASPYYHGHLFRYHVAFYLPHAPGEMVVAEALDFPGAVTQGFDLPDARLMIASALEDLARRHCSKRGSRCLYHHRKRTVPRLI